MYTVEPRNDEIAVIHQLPTDQLGLEVSTPVGEAPPLLVRSLAARLRAALASAGGVAGSTYLAVTLGLASGREVRAALRGGRVTYLGAGYLALPATVEIPVDRWLTARILRDGPVEVDAAVTAVLAHYPHGDAASVRAWLRQEPERLRIDRDVVWVLGAQRPQFG